MHKLGSLVHAPINCTTFLCRTFLQVKRKCKNKEQTRPKKIQQPRVVDNTVAEDIMSNLIM